MRPAEAPVYPAVCGTTPIAVGRGWVPQCEEVADESWLEGLERQCTGEPSCHEKGSNCSLYANQMETENAIIKPTVSDFQDWKTGLQDTVCKCAMECKLPHIFGGQWRNLSFSSTKISLVRNQGSKTSS